MSQKELLEYDDSDAIQFILKHLEKEEITNVLDDDVQYILDLICEYYEKCNLLNDDAAEEANIEEDDMFNYLTAVLKKENVVTLDDATLQAILDGEYEYGLSIGIYED